MINLKLTVSVLAIAVAASAATAGDQIHVAGSSTVLPFATIAAEAFGDNGDFKSPVVEGGGTGAGLKKFCEGAGEETIDIATASRKIKDEELATCKTNGVTDIMQVQIGFDGIVFASDIKGADFALTPSDVYKALAAEVVVDGKLVPNTAAKWSDVNPALPAQDIIAFVPGTKHGTREVFETKVLEAGCKDTKAEDAIKALKGDDKAAVAKACTAMRTDGKAVDIDGDYTETLARIASEPNGVGVFGLSFYENNTDKLKVATVSGVTPSVETIADGTYPVSRPLFIYVKKAHIGTVPGLKEFAAFFVSDEMAGPDGKMAEYGLVTDPKLADQQKAVEDETTLQ
ncbi:MAG: substrate-binding domain-containing protein [Paracoccaceae bacterium]